MRLLIVSDWGPWAGAEQSQVMRPEETGGGAVYRKGDADSKMRASWSRRHGRPVPGRQCHMAHVSPFWSPPPKPKAPGTAEISAD